ncbi:LysR family transcriptional regulator [Catenuloplanes japonicus]|uniref:LysR substrate-binding domain-containing protein n=1 Tax=Catenuloplanes japonicus TaxID=33876 RepID=UPI00068FF730|nr:LysR family transcriptional regulator [Catenuloplanes japonicus]
MNGFDIDVSALRSFVVLAIVRSYTAAARELAITPSGLTKRIQTLERRLGTPLIIRDHGGVGGLTPAGTTLIRGAVGLLDAVERITLSAGRDAGPRVRIGVQGLDPAVFQRRQLRVAALALRAVHPGASIEFSLLGYEEPADALRSRRADLTLTALPPAGDDVESTRLWPMERVGVLPARHPLARRGVVDAEEFAAYPMLFIPAISADFMSLWSLGDTRPLSGARLVDIAPRDFHEIYRSIASTGGTLALHPEAARNRPRDLRTVTLRGAPRTWYHISRRRDAHHTRADAFLRFLHAG